MTAAKTAPKKTVAKAAPKTSGKPGPKPKFQVVENTLKCQTSLDGEVTVSLVVPFATVKKIINIEDIPESEMLDYIHEQIMPQAELDKVLGLQDGIDTFNISIEYIKALSERLGANFGVSLGESGSSSD